MTVGWRRADEAVAGAQVMIEKGERTIGRERRKPQRQSSELHRHRIDVHAVQTALRDRAPEVRALRGVMSPGVTPAVRTRACS